MKIGVSSGSSVTSTGIGWSGRSAASPVRSLICVSEAGVKPDHRSLFYGARSSISVGARLRSRLTMNVGIRKLLAVVILAAGAATSVFAQDPEATTREAAIAQAQADKVPTLHQHVPDKGEALFNRAEDILVNGVPNWHPFFESAYYGGGFTLGAGYAHHVSPYNTLDVRGSYTVLGYKRIEAELTAPRLFHRRGSLSLLGGWREATQAAFYGFGMGTS